MKKRLKSIFLIVKYSVLEFFDDKSLSVAAAIAYYTFQSLFPLVLILILIASFFLNSESSARQSLIQGINTALPQVSGLNIGNIINNIAKSAPSLLSITALFLLWSGTNIFDQLIFGINTAYDVEKDTRSFLVKLGLRFGFFVALGLLIALGYLISILLELLFQTHLKLFGFSTQDVNFLFPFILSLIPLFLMFCVFVILYKYAPDRKGVRWKDVLLGALVAAILFELLKRGFTLYVTWFNAKDSYSRTYGFLGGVLLFLLYLWLNAVVMLLGAEIASVMGGWKTVGKKSAPEDDNPGTEKRAHQNADRMAKGDSRDLEQNRKKNYQKRRPAQTFQRNLIYSKRPKLLTVKQNQADTEQ